MIYSTTNAIQSEHMYQRMSNLVGQNNEKVKNVRLKVPSRIEMHT